MYSVGPEMGNVHAQALTTLSEAMGPLQFCLFEDGTRVQRYAGKLSGITVECARGVIDLCEMPAATGAVTTGELHRPACEDEPEVRRPFPADEHDAQFLATLVSRLSRGPGRP